ncbi:MAG: phosphoribosylamine--glycine ligase [Candidatus Nealsonbacteria bacterium]
MKVLVVGSGAREHAIAWRLKQSHLLTDLFVAPGNAGTAKIAKNLDVDIRNNVKVARAAKSLKIDLVVVGPDEPLANGMVNYLKDRNISVFGPKRKSAEMEWSKSFAIEVMYSAFVPFPRSKVFYSGTDIRKFVSACSYRLVVKADGLASGKGVWLPKEKSEIIDAALKCRTNRPKEPVILQEFLEGREVSVFCFVDGEHISSLVAACDYKRLKDGDEGPNTGSMGSYAWPIFWTDELEKFISEKIILPVIKELKQRGRPFVGILYAGLILTKDGPKVLEFNARFGDSEAQVILPLLISDPIEIMMACIEGRLEKTPVIWRKDISCVGAVMASRGYPDPDKCESGLEIEGLDEKFNIPDSLIFHAHTKEINENGKIKIITGKGRVLTVVGIDKSLPGARSIAYQRLALVSFLNEHRNDIAL